VALLATGIFFLGGLLQLGRLDFDRGVRARDASSGEAAVSME
jgi:hypothetical protein